MFDKIVDGIRYIGWILYAGMTYFISSIYNTLITIPNNLSKVLNDDSVNTLFKASTMMFFIFTSLMIAVLVLSRMLDWNINKMMNQLKKIFLLSLIIITLPWIYTQVDKITNTFIASANNVMTSETNKSNSNDLGVSMANIYIYKNEKYSNSKGYGELEDNPFSEQTDITDSNIINRKIKDENGKEVYAYSYLNPILGILLNVALIGLLVLTTIKVYGYLYKILVIKIWIPIKMIYDGFNDTPISDGIYEIISSFTSFAIQLVIIPFSVIMLDIMSTQVGDNIFLQIVSIFVALWFMFTGVDYIQSKFQGQSGIPSVLEGYATMKMVQAGVNTAKGILPSKSKKQDDIGSVDFNNDEQINTGRENDIKPENNVENANDDVTDGENINNENIIQSEMNGQNSGSGAMNDKDEFINSNSEEQVNNDMQNENQIDNDSYNANHQEEELKENQMINDDDSIMLNKDEVNESITNTEDGRGLNKEMRGNDMQANDMQSLTSNEKQGIDHSYQRENIQPVNQDSKINFPATEKQVEFAKSLGIEVEGKNKFELGQEIEKVKNMNNGSKYVEPKFETPKIDSKERVSVEELERLLNEEELNKDG